MCKSVWVVTLTNCGVSFVANVCILNLSRRLDVMCRVKDQRMKGQSGIGDDFRVWRTDDEMRMRQAYD